METCYQIYSKLSTFFNTFDFITRTPIVFSLKKMGNSTLKLFIKIMRSWNINQTFSRHFKCVHSKNITEACRSCFGWFLWIRLNLVLLIVWFFSEWRFQQKYCEYIKFFETSVISVFIKNTDRLYREAWVPRRRFYAINTELVRGAATESSPSDNYLKNFLKWTDWKWAKRAPVVWLSPGSERATDKSNSPWEEGCWGGW